MKSHYDSGKRIIKYFMNNFFRVYVHGKENIPEGAAILASNHSSIWDPFLILTQTERKIHFIIRNFRLTKNRLYYPVVRFLENAEQIIRKDESKKSLESTIEDTNKRLKNNELVGIFPEGYISYSGTIGNFQSGVSYFSYNSGAPVIPVYLKGANKARIFDRIDVIFGSPVYPNGGDYKEMTKIIRDKVIELSGEKHSQCYAPNQDSFS